MGRQEKREGKVFQSTSPVRGTTGCGWRGLEYFSISIHVPREGDDRQSRQGVSFGLDISIHVPREGDDKAESEGEPEMSISIHVPREGDD